MQDEAGLADQTLHQVSQRTEVSLTNGTEAANGRHKTIVQRADYHLGELRADTSRALGKTVHQADHRSPHDRGRRRRPLGNEVTPDQEPAQAPACRSVKHDALPLRERRRQTVDGGLRPQRLLDDLPGSGHPVARRRGEDNLIPPLSDGGKGIDRE